MYHISYKSVWRVNRIAQTPNVKPEGLWYAQGNSWIRWCERNQWGDPRQAKKYRVKLRYTDNLVRSAPTRVLKLSTLAALYQFTHLYVDLKTEKTSRPVLRWDRVAEKFAGIEVRVDTINVPLKALKYLWFHNLDVISGCVWDPAGVRALTYIPTRV